MDQKRLHILEEMPVPKAIGQLALPVILGMLVQIFYNLADTFFVGMLGDPLQVAAVSLAMPAFMIIVAVGGIFGQGGASYVSRLLGQKDYHTARQTATASGMACLITAVVLGGLGLVFLPQIMPILGTSADTAGFTASYLRIIFWALPISMLNFSFSQLMRAEGAARASVVGQVLGTGVNIVLDPIFILWLGWGVTGAAVATVIGNAAALVYYYWYYRSGHSAVTPGYKYVSWSRDMYWEIIKIGIPASLGQVMMSIGTTLSNNLSASYGDYYVAAMGVAMRVFSLPIFVFIGLAAGVQPLIGYCYGAGDKHRLHQSSSTAQRYALMLAGLFIVIFLAFPGAMVQAFIRNQEVVHIGRQILQAMTLAIPFAALGMQYSISLVAMGRALPSLILSLSRQGIIYIPSILLLNKLFGFAGLVFALPLADMATAVIGYFFYHAGIREMDHNPRKALQPEADQF